MLRFTNDYCINCGGDKPATVEKETDRDYITYKCPKCNHIIMHGVVSDGRSRVRVPRAAESRLIDISTDLPEGVMPSTWEVYWCDTFAVEMMNGVPISGTDDAQALVTHILSIYDD